MKKQLLLFILIISTVIQLKAEEAGKYDLLFISGTVKPSANADRLSEQRAAKGEIIDGKYFRIIQFWQIPTDAEKEELKSKGVDLICYLPNFSFFSAIAESAEITALNSRGNIRALLPVLPEYKLYPELKDNKLPADAEVVKGQADLVITYFKGISAELILKQLESIVSGLKILEHDPASQTVNVRVQKEYVSKITLASGVQYVEPVMPWKMENNSGTTEHRSNTINNFIPGGLRYDGAGVGVSIGDGGAYFTHVDYIGRQSGGLSSGAADHGTHVAGIVAGAGNIDPRYRGQAPGATLIYSNGFADISSVSAITALYNGTNKIRITNHSLGEAANAGYTSTARQSDLQVESLPSIFNVHSAGNSGTAWLTITGGYKAGKNAIAMGALDYKDLVASFSSRGPSKDGRIKPDICTKGSSVQSTMPNNVYGGMSGTSMASPGGAGCFAQLIDAYRDLNSGSDPKLAQLKCIALNTAEDLGNTGPDYTYGWGRMNVWKAYNVIKDKRYLSATVATGATNKHTITVPANVGELKVMVYWADPAAAAGVSKALINDLDISLASASQAYSPWQLDFSSPGNAAIKGQDKDNNMEQVSVLAPAAGTYSLSVNGFQVPQGPQEYWVTYEFLTDDIKVTYPIGGESFVPGETEYLRWDTYGTSGNFTIEYSTDGGTTWTNITSAATGASRFYTWTVPSTLTGQARVRISRSGKTGTSEANFNIINVPTALKIDWRCPASFQLSWTAVAGATSYEAYLLGQKYMEPQGTTTGTSFWIQSPNTSVTWASVRALAANGQTIGRRAVAIQVPTAVTGCLTSVDKNEGNAYLVSVFPNPVNDHSVISLNIAEEENISIKLMDVCGREIASLAEGKQLSAGEHQFKLDQIHAAGMYMVMIKGKRGVAYEKVMVTGM